MFDYTIANYADEQIFNKQCKAIVKQFDGITFSDSPIDVDGSVSRVYSYEGKKIIVCNDYYLDAVLIKSEIDFEKLDWN